MSHSFDGGVYMISDALVCGIEVVKFKVSYGGIQFSEVGYDYFIEVFQLIDGCEVCS